MDKKSNAPWLYLVTLVGLAVSAALPAVTAVPVSASDALENHAIDKGSSVSMSAVVGTWKSIMHERLMHYPQGISYSMTLKLQDTMTGLPSLKRETGHADIIVVTNGRPPSAKCVGSWWLTSSSTQGSAEIHVVGLTPEYSHRCQFNFAIDAFSTRVMTLRSDDWPFPPSHVASFCRIVIK